ncbi:MAG: hypothetical protein KKG93_12775 [Bacteroidetes bacterium]|nr:hypothetical protein [Bacteroidota bacterium]
MGINIIDPMVIFKKKESRGLKTAYLFYCDRALENAHDAEVVTRAAKEIFLAQLEYYNDIGNNLNEISAFSSYDDFRQADISRKLLYNENGQLIFNYGKHRHKLVADHLDHVQWVLDNDFPEDTKEILRDFLNNR